MSLLYPRDYQSSFPPLGTMEALEEHLRLSPIIRELLYVRDMPPKQPLLYYATTDPAVIAYRQAILSDLMQNEVLLSVLDEMYYDLMAVEDIYTSRSITGSAESNLYKAKEILLLISCVDRLSDCFSTLKKPLASQGLSTMANNLMEFADSPEYQTLKKNCEAFEKEVSGIRSITLGANLNAKMQVEEVGIVSVNDQPYHSGNLTARLFRMDFNNRDFLTLEPLAPLSQGKDANNLHQSVVTVLNKLFSRFSSSFAKAIRSLTMANIDKLPLFSELRFYLGAVRLIKKLRDAGLPMCAPRVSRDKATVITDLYNPSLFLSGKADGQSIVKNDIRFDAEAGLYILTGPNNGGKTVFLQAVGIAQLLFQLGLFVPATEAAMTPVTSLLTYFSDVETEAFGAGKFMKECELVKGLLEQADDRSMVLLNEPFTSTNLQEGVALCDTVIRLLAKTGAKGIVVTHFHELTKLKDEVNAQYPRTKLENLSAGIADIQSADGLTRRTYVMQRGTVDTRGFAKEIAAKYGIDESLLRRGG